MKGTLILIPGILFLFFAALPVSAEPVNEFIEKRIQELQHDPISQYWLELTEKYGGFFPENKLPSFMEMITPGGEGLRASDVLYGIAKFFLQEILYNGKLLVSIVMLTVLCMILETLQNAFERKAVSRIAYAIAYMVLMILAINSFSVAIGYAKSAIDSMIQFMIAMIPLLLTLMVSMGNLTTVSVLHPLIVFMIHAIGTLIYIVIFPLLFFSAVLHIVSSLSEKYKVSQLANLLRTIGVGLLGVFFTVFLGVISVQGISGSVFDGISVRIAKFVSGNFIPVIGNMFSDAADTVIGASLLVKNAIGLVGVIIIFMICAFPSLKILALAAIYSLSAAVLQPLGTSPITVCLETIGKSLVYVFAALATVGMMFFLALTIIIAAGNAAIMLR